MKTTLSSKLALTLALGGVVAGVVSLLPMDEGSRDSGLIGAVVAAVLGAVTLVLKTQLGRGLTGNGALKAMMTAQGLAFLLRLVAVGVGAVILKQNDTMSLLSPRGASSPFAFVIAFFAVSLAQQVLETKSLLAGATMKVIS
ncbi:MAG: hypothetical protein Q8L48_43805 [Archangium sp.]|nr:hypothetical protein [Archangium sp.]